MAPWERDWLASATWALPEAICSPAAWIWATSSSEVSRRAAFRAPRTISSLVSGCDVEGEVAGGQLLQGVDHFLLQTVGKSVHGLGHRADFILALHVEAKIEVPLPQLFDHMHRAGQRPDNAAGDHYPEAERSGDADQNRNTEEPDHLPGNGFAGVGARFHFPRLRSHDSIEKIPGLLQRVGVDLEGLLLHGAGTCQSGIDRTDHVLDVKIELADSRHDFLG